MSYLDELMGDGESILFATRHHWFILFARVLAELILLLLLGAVAAVSAQAWQPNGRWVALGAGILALFVFLSALRDFFRWRSEQFVVTDRRVLQLKGILDKNVLDSSLEKINDVELHQSFLGRMFNYGSIEILTASEEAVNRMDAIEDPIQFKRAMQDARARYDGFLDRGPVRAYEQPASDLQGVLEQLAALHARGILSDAEFEAKKRDVLSRI